MAWHDPPPGSGPSQPPASPTRRPLAAGRSRLAVQVAVHVDGGRGDAAQRHVSEDEDRVGVAHRGGVLRAEAGAADLLEVVDVVVADDEQPLARAGGQLDREVLVGPGAGMTDIAEADDRVARPNAPAPLLE